MKIVDLEQNTPEWLSWRKDKLGASDAAAIMERSPYMTPKQLYRQKKGLDKPPFETAAMSRGKALEPEARELLNLQLKGNFVPCCGVHENIHYMAVSLDGFDRETDEICEIKCPGLKVFEEILRSRQLPGEYFWQIQHALAVSGAESCYCFVYNPEHEEKYIIFMKHIDRDLKEEILIKEAEFYAYLSGKVEPPAEWLEEALVRNDDAWSSVAAEYSSLNKSYAILEQERKLLEKERHRLKAELIELADEKPSRGCGVNLIRVTREGAIDAKRLQKDTGVAVEQYRKPSTVFWRVDVEVSNIHRDDFVGDLAL